VNWRIRGRNVKVLVALLLLAMVAVGSIAVWFGQVDDSPGLGGIGLIIIGSVVAIAVRTLR
jgi:uncharacterized membrane protein